METDKLKDYWEEEERAVAGFYGNPPNIEAVHELDKAFQLSDRVLRCIDERTPGGIPCAGSGILLGDKAYEFLDKMHLDGVTSHEGCGAAKMAALKAGVPAEKTEEFAREWSENIARKLGVPYMGHLPVDPEFHIARVAYYDGTGKFDFSQAPELPTGFRISRRNFSREYSQTEIDVAASIAMGDHGYGKLISSRPGTQFIFIAIGDPQERDFSLVKLMEELRPVAALLNEKVIVRGFESPV